jgi:alpha-beta hydrolase superfamily lysophospholipase
MSDGAADALTQEQIEGLDWSDLCPARAASRDGVKHEQGFLQGVGGVELYWQSWSPADGTSRARLLLMHGYGEHCTRYDHVAVALVRAGYAVEAIDARGHGRSSGVIAHVDRYDEYVDDLSIAREHLLSRWGDERGPLYIFGHSNGGLIVLRSMLRSWSNIAGYVVTSPMCGLAVKVPLWKSTAGDVMSKVWPTLALPTELSPSVLSHEQHVVTVYSSDPLVRKVATARWFTEAKDAQRDLLARAHSVKQPLLMMIAGDDRIVDPRAAEEVFARIGSADKEQVLYRELFHELLNEGEWTQILRRIVSWMEARRG